MTDQEVRKKIIKIIDRARERNAAPKCWFPRLPGFLCECRACAEKAALSQKDTTHG